MNDKGFTLIEILIVVAIIAILGAIAIPQLGAYKARAVRSKMLGDAKNIAINIEVVMSECNAYTPVNGFSFSGPGTSLLVPDMSLCSSSPGGNSPIVTVSSGNLISILATTSTWTLTVTNWGGNDINFIGPLTRKNDGSCKWANDADC